MKVGILGTGDDNRSAGNADEEVCQRDKPGLEHSIARLPGQIMRRERQELVPSV